MSGGTSSTILRNLDPDTVYNVALIPVYPDVEGILEQEKGKTSKSPCITTFRVSKPARFGAILRHCSVDWENL